jgi:ribosomal protein S18 acetylase RimI-like enzyme
MPLPVNGGGTQPSAGGLDYRDALAEDLPAVRTLFQEYARSIGIDLSFQGFDEELASLPGKYAPPHGALILAWRDGKPCGCVAFRRIGPRTCEMKRLYVRPENRGLKIGAELVRRIIQAAEARGYEAMRLDTLQTMQSAVSLYRSFGFRDIEPYIYNPIPGARFMEKTLGSPSAAQPLP